MPILGGGKEDNPDNMFIFINPTHKNQSSSKEWKGSRYPFIGTRQVWRIFHKAGLFDNGLMKRIEETREWD